MCNEQEICRLNLRRIKGRGAMGDRVDKGGRSQRRNYYGEGGWVLISVDPIASF